MAHTDSPYIRALGFMYIRYTQPPADLYDWYEEYLQDEEEVDVKAGGGQVRCKLIKLSYRNIFLNLYCSIFTDNDDRANSLPMAYKIGLVLDIISTHSGPNSETN